MGQDAFAAENKIRLELEEELRVSITWIWAFVKEIVNP